MSEMPMLLIEWLQLRSAQIPDRFISSPFEVRISIAPVTNLHQPQSGRRPQSIITPTQTKAPLPTRIPNAGNTLIGSLASCRHTRITMYQMPKT